MGVYETLSEILYNGNELTKIENLQTKQKFRNTTIKAIPYVKLV